MNISKFTQKSVEAINGCEKLAYEFGNQEIDQEHLLYSLVTMDDSMLCKLLERMEILAAIREVDEVVAITDDPSRLLEWDRRPFDCFFSGDDYSGNPYWKWEREELQKRGSDIVFFPYTEEQSTTKIREKLEL